MWIWMAVGSAVLLGLYDVAKKQSVTRNGVLEVLLCATALSTLFLSPFLSAGPMKDHLALMLKAVLVTASWVSGLAAMKLLPMTIASTIKASRPVFVLLFSILIFGERLNALQWGGVALTLTSLLMLSVSGKREGIDFLHSRGVMYMAVSVFTGVASALYDKLIMMSMAPLFVQSWTNLYITVLLALCVLVSRLVHRDGQKFRWDWMLVVIAVLITLADFLYFSALNQEGSMLSVISLARRGSVIVAFFCGALVFREKRVGAKAIVLGVLLAGLVLLVLGSS
ncbi:MAG: DMT family transporter [Bacteroidales bacterium]|nr:DMT family transporter [Bacteroidales bacterium]